MLSQAHRLYNLLSDGQKHRTDEILRTVYGGDHLGLSRIGARVWDIKQKHDEVEIDGWKDKDNPSLYWYQMRLKQRVFLPPKETKVALQTSFL